MTNLPKIEPTPMHKPLPVPKGRIVAPLCVSFMLLYFAFKFLVAQPQGHVLGNEFVAGGILIFGTLTGALVASTALVVAMWLRRQDRNSRQVEIAACATAWLVLALNLIVPVWYVLTD